MAALVDEGDGFRRYLAAIRRLPTLDREEEALLARRYRDGDQAAGHALAQANLRHVVAIALGYKGYGVRLSDLVEEGTLGLMEAVRRFDPSRELRFMTYAAYWVRANILAFVLKQHSIVGVGTGPQQSRLFFRLTRERAKAAAELGDDPMAIDEAVAGTLGVSAERVRAMGARLATRDASLDAPAWREGEVSGIEVLADESSPIDDEVAAAERDRAVRAAVGTVWATLDERERLIVRERLLGDDEDGATLADLGKKLNLSRERVRQLEERVKRKLRRALEPVARAA